MISNEAEHSKALQDLVFLQTWLEELYREHPDSGKRLTKASVRKKMAQLHEELAAYEGRMVLADKRA